MKRSGTADLPLHGGRVPEWLASRMTAMGTALAETIILEYGVSEFLTRISDPYWFQAFGCVLGMDWHSSGITTSVLGALKRGLNPRSHELGMLICGGRGRHSRRTPDELRGYAERTGLDGEALVRASRLTARVDNNAIADGFQIYLHGFAITAQGEWTVVQQGLNDTSGRARRYHWHSKTVRDFVNEPHSGIAGESQGVIRNLVDQRASSAQRAILELSRARPDETIAEVRKLMMPAHHDVRPKDVDLERLGAILAVAYERDLHDFAELLLVEKLGPRTLETLAFAAEVVHGTPTRFRDPARYAFSLGGKDGHPFPVPLKTYDESISVLRTALDRAKAGDRDKLDGLRRLEGFVRRVEAETEAAVDFDALVEHEHQISPSLHGRTVFDDRSQPPAQMNFDFE